MGKEWEVVFTRKAFKQKSGLPRNIAKILFSLIKEIINYRPVRGNWPNYKFLDQLGCHHCHLKKRGKPTYVALWRVEDKKIKIVEVVYVGTREKALY